MCAKAIKKVRKINDIMKNGKVKKGEKRLT